MLQPNTKICTACKRKLPITNFYRDKGSRDGYFLYCKQCVSIRKSGIKVVKDLPNEIWKPIEGFSTYFVSNCGRIKHVLDSQRQNLRIPHKTSNGYLRLVLSEGNHRKTISVHRAVAEAFIPNPNNLDSVNHKDFDTTNNEVENLEWLSIKDNIRHSCRNGRHSRKPVLQLDKTGILIREWESGLAVEKELGYFGTLISRVCQGKQKTYKGFIWRYKK